MTSSILSPGGAPTLPSRPSARPLRGRGARRNLGEEGQGHAVSFDAGLTGPPGPGRGRGGLAQVGPPARGARAPARPARDPRGTSTGRPPRARCPRAPVPNPFNVQSFQRISTVSFNIVV